MLEEIFIIGIAVVTPVIFYTLVKYKKRDKMTQVEQIQSLITHLEELTKKRKKVSSYKRNSIKIRGFYGIQGFYSRGNIIIRNLLFITSYLC